MKKAIVIGATSGIGLEVARLLAERGYSATKRFQSHYLLVAA